MEGQRELGFCPNSQLNKLERQLDSEVTYRLTRMCAHIYLRA